MNETGAHKKLSDAQLRIEYLEDLVMMGMAVVEDFLPNVGQCALQDFGRLNDFLIAANREKKRESNPL